MKILSTLEIPQNTEPGVAQCLEVCGIGYLRHLPDAHPTLQLRNILRALSAVRQLSRQH